MSFLSAMLLSTGLLLMFFARDAYYQGNLYVAVFAGLFALVILTSRIGKAVQHLKLAREIGDLENSASQLGDAKMASIKHIRSGSWTGNDLRSSCFFGAAGKDILSYAGDSHLMTVAPNNAGKTESIVIPNMLSLTRNVVGTDKGGEVAVATFEHRRDRLNQTIIAINPYALHVDQGLPAHRFNPLGRLVHLARNNDPDILDEARGFADLLVPHNKDAGANQIFQDKGRELDLWAMLQMAYDAAEFGAPCSLPRLYELLSSSEDDLKAFFAAMASAPQRLNGEIARMGEAFLADYKRSPKTMGAYINNAQAQLMIYSPSGYIGRNTMESDFDPGILKSGKATVYIVAPPEQLTGSGGKWAAIVLYSLIRTLWGARQKYPRVTILADEFQNLSQSPIPLIPQVLTVGRSYGIQLWTFVQDLRAYEKYGDDSTLFMTQSAIAQYWQVRNTDDAEYLEKRAGVTGVVSESINADEKDDPSKRSYSQTSVPVLRAHQVMQLAPFKQLIVHESKPVIEADLVSFRQIKPLNKWTSDRSQPMTIRFNLTAMFKTPDTSPDVMRKGQ